MEITRVMRGRARPTAPPSLRVQILLVGSAFLCGAVLAALLFVGIWRHTAADGARAHAVQAADHRLLVGARHRLAALTTQLARSQSLLVAARRSEGRAQASLAAERRAERALGRSLPPKLQAVDAAARTLASKLATLRSELTALRSYLRRPGPTGVDPAYLAAQAGYLVGSVDAAAAAAGGIAQDTQAAGAAATTLTHVHK